MKNFHNIESLKPLSKARTFPYVGYAKSGTKYYAQRREGVRGWRFAVAVATLVDEPGYFYVRTLAEASAKLETINGKATAAPVQRVSVADVFSNPKGWLK